MQRPRQFLDQLALSKVKQYGHIQKF
jgi:hypothetical protein